MRGMAEATVDIGASGGAGRAGPAPEGLKYRIAD